MTFGALALLVFLSFPISIPVAADSLSPPLPCDGCILWERTEPGLSHQLFSMPDAHLDGALMFYDATNQDDAEALRAVDATTGLELASMNVSRCGSPVTNGGFGAAGCDGLARYDPTSGFTQVTTATAGVGTIAEPWGQGFVTVTANDFGSVLTFETLTFEIYDQQGSLTSRTNLSAPGNSWFMPPLEITTAPGNAGIGIASRMHDNGNDLYFQAIYTPATGSLAWSKTVPKFGTDNHNNLPKVMPQPNSNAWVYSTYDTLLKHSTFTYSAPLAPPTTLATITTSLPGAILFSDDGTDLALFARGLINVNGNGGPTFAKWIDVPTMSKSPTLEVPGRFVDAVVNGKHAAFYTVDHAENVPNQVRVYEIDIDTWTEISSINFEAANAQLQPWMTYGDRNTIAKLPGEHRFAVSLDDTNPESSLYKIQRLVAIELAEITN